MLRNSKVHLTGIVFGLIAGRFILLGKYLGAIIAVIAGLFIVIMFAYRDRV